MRIRSPYWAIRNRKRDGLHFTEAGMRRRREADAAALVREQRAELARQKAEREASDHAAQ